LEISSDALYQISVMSLLMADEANVKLALELVWEMVHPFCDKKKKLPIRVHSLGCDELIGVHIQCNLDLRKNFEEPSFLCYLWNEDLKSCQEH